MIILKIFVRILLFFILVFIFIKLFFPYYKVTTYSMDPTIRKGQIIFVSRLHYQIFKPKRNDIVLLRPDPSVFTKGVWTHRIIAIKEDEVEIENGKVKVNGEEIIHSVLRKSEDTKLRVPIGMIFQKGDNPDTIYGLIDEDLILGRIIFYF